MTLTSLVWQFRLRPLSSIGLDRSAVPEPFSMNYVQEQLLIDIPELNEASKKILDRWNPISIDSINADASMGKDEDMKYYCEEPWLMETITSHADVTAASKSGMKLNCVIYLYQSLASHSRTFS